MEKEVNSKAKNAPQLWIMLLANILIIAGMIFPQYYSQLTNDFNVVILIRSLGVFIAPLLLFLLNGLLSPNQKAILVFWKLKNALPGCEAFTRLSKRDPRVDIKKLQELHGALPKNPVDQNRLWYKIYKKHSQDIIVSESHRAFLLARDLTSLSVLLIVFMGLPAVVFGIWPVALYYFCFLLLQYFVIVIGAQNRGKRFVSNVLAIESK